MDATTTQGGGAWRPASPPGEAGQGKYMRKNLKEQDNNL
jgi:hypothetical protein